MRAIFLLKYSAINSSNIMLQHRLFNFCILQRRNINCALPNYFLKNSRNVLRHQSRGIRHKAKGFGSDDTSHDKTSTKEEHKKESNEGDKYKQFAGDEEKFKQEFFKKFEEFVSEYGKDLVKNPSKAKFLNDATLEFIKKFNEKSSASGFAVEKNENTVKRFIMINALLAAVSALFMLFIFSAEGMTDEHAQIIKMSDTINFDRFVKDYLNVGEVKGIFYYPNKKLAVAMLHPDAIIGGKSASTNGVAISMSDREDFNYNPMLFVHSIRDAEYNLGVDQRENVPILVRQTVSTAKKAIYALLLILTFVVLLNYYRSSVRNGGFRIISSAANKNKEKK